MLLLVGLSGRRWLTHDMVLSSFPLFRLMYIFPNVYGNNDGTLRILSSRPLWS